MSTLLKIAPGKTKLYIFFPHAGGISETAYSFKQYLPQEYGLYSVDYSAYEFKEFTFRELACKILATFNNIWHKNIILIGSSYGAYLAYIVNQVATIYHKLPAKALILTSVLDIPTLQKTISKQDFNIKNLVDNFDHMPIEIQNDTLLALSRDIQILRSLQPIGNFKTTSDIYVFNGTFDKQCNQNIADLFWSKQTTGYYSYNNYNGNHIPNAKNWKEIFTQINDNLF